MSKRYNFRIFSSAIVGCMLLLASVFSGFEARAQWVAYDGLVCETVMIHDGVSTAPIPAGFVTYRVWVQMQNPTDFLSAVFALAPNELHITTSTTFWHDVFDSNSEIGANNSCVGMMFSPTLMYDSHVTVGKNCDTEPGGAVLGAYAIPLNPMTNFSAGGSIDMIDGAWFTTNGNVNGQAGPDLKVLLGQFTTNGVLNVCVNLQVFPLGNGLNEEQIFNQCITCTNPCEISPLDMEAYLLNNVTCNGAQNGAISVEALPGGIGNPGYTFDVYEVGDPNTIVVTDADGVIDNLPPGEYYVEITDSAGCTDVTGNVIITEPTPLQAGLNLTGNNLCFGDEDGAFTIAISGGTAPYTVFLNGVDLGNQTSFDNLPCGNYVIDIVDFNNCIVTLNQAIACPAEILVNLQSDNISCFEECDGNITGTISGGTGGLSAVVTGPGFNQNLNGGNQIAVNLQNLCPGTYTIEITDGNGCTSEDEFTLTEPSELIVDLETTNVSCFGSCDGTASVTISGGTVPYNTNWGNNVNPNALCAGNYTVIVTDGNQCQVSIPFQITQPTQITISTDVIDVTCPGDNDASINAIASGGVPGYTYTLTGPINGGPQDNGSFTGLTGGAYTVTVTDDTGCIATDDVNIFSPNSLVLDVEFENVNCFGADDGQIITTSSGGTAPLTVTVNGTPGGPVFNDLGPGIYEVILTDDNGCSISETVTLEEPTELQAGLVSTTDVGCGGDCDGSAEVTATGGVIPYDFEWNDNPFQQDDELCAGDNILVVTDNNGCTDTLEVLISEPDPIQILINANPVTCTGMTDGSAAVVAIGGTGTLTLDLYGLDPDELDNLPEGEYPVTAYDETGCFANDTIVIIAAIVTDMQIELFSSPVSCWDMDDGTGTVAVIGGFPPITIQWDDPYNQTTATAVGLAVETYGVTVTDEVGCTLDTTITIDPTIGCFYIATVLTPNGDGSNDTWLIGGLDYFPNALVQVFNRWGQLLFESRGYSVPWDGTYDDERLPIADYYYVIEYDPNEDPLTGTVTIKY